MPRIGIISCRKIKDITCVSCIKCFKAIAERQGEFARYDEIEVVFMGDCGGCPGLVMPKMGLIMDMARAYGRDVDVVHLGTCVMKARETAGCPLDP
ncbi:MAG: CGGC domain-containing protein, partial [Firmicutes bacterium]|nr:CGGC domain-containing protein [Bacillota bacterium]